MEQVSCQGAKALHGGIMNAKSVPSELMIDRYLLGEATEDEIRKVKLWLSEDPDGAAYLSRKEGLVAMSQAAMPATFDELAEKVAQRHSSRKGNPGRMFSDRPVWLVGVLVVVAVAVVIFVKQPDDVWTTKGGEDSYCVLKRGSEILRVSEKAACGAGDTVQVFHAAESAPYVMLFYAEYGGDFTPCLSADTALLMSRESTHAPLPFSIAIDTTKGELRLALVASVRPFSTAEGMASLKNGGSKRLRITHYTFMRE